MCSRHDRAEILLKLALNINQLIDKIVNDKVSRSIWL